MSRAYEIICDAVCKTAGYTMLALSLHGNGIVGATLEFMPNECLGIDNKLALEYGVAIGKNGVVIIPEDYTDNILMTVMCGDAKYIATVSANTPAGQEIVLEVSER